MKPPSGHQQVILGQLINWYNGNKTFGVLHGIAGSGKTFVVQHLFGQLGSSVRPLLLAETNEAVNVLNRSTDYKFDCKTVCSALGLTLKQDEGKLVLVQYSIPDLSKYNLLLIDEASMLDDMKLNIINELGIRTLYVGHSSQLPPVDTKLTSTDKCTSPVFVQNYTTFNLLEAVRNTGELAAFCDETESLIYKRGILSNKYVVNKQFFADYLANKSLSNNFLTGSAILVAWTNKTVESYNQQIRVALYGNVAIQNDFIEGDRVIFRSPVSAFIFPLRNTDKSIESIFKDNSHNDYSTNTKGIVTMVNEVAIMGINCYELHVTTDHFERKKSKGIVYVVIDEEKYDALQKKAYLKALYGSISNSNKNWEAYHNLTYLFSNTKHAYAITVHCSQGSTIETVFVDDNDIAKCSNPYLKKKLKYVAYSRASKNLHRIN